MSAWPCATVPGEAKDKPFKKPWVSWGILPPHTKGRDTTCASSSFWCALPHVSFLWLPRADLGPLAQEKKKVEEEEEEEDGLTPAAVITIL